MFDMDEPFSYEDYTNGIEHNDPRLEATYGMNCLDPKLFKSQGGFRESYEQFMYLFSLKRWNIGNVNEDYGCHDPYRTYTQNSNGLRGDKEFDSQVDLIATGCSQTFGLGVPQEATWAARLADSLNMSHATIAAPGWSVQEMVDSVMVHIRKYGKPKLIAALLPDFGRTIMVEKSDSFISERPNPTNGDLKFKVKGFHYDGSNEIVRLSKRPHASNEVLPPEFYTHIAGQAWAHFIEYCRVADIQLIWTSWDTAVLEQYSLASAFSKHEKVNFEEAILDLSGFFRTKFHQYERQYLELLDQLDCHSELKDMWPECFREGTDLCRHYGTHAHAHIAEEFLDKYYKAENGL